jgi:hypothetical protein
MDQYVQPLISALILCVVGVLSYSSKKAVDIGITYMQSKLGASQMQLFRDMASTVVRNLQQNPAFKDLEGSLKKERAIVEMTDYAGKIGLPVDTSFVGKVIEEAVQIMNSELGESISWLGGEPTIVTAGKAE